MGVRKVSNYKSDHEDYSQSQSSLMITFAAKVAE